MDCRILPTFQVEEILDFVRTKAKKVAKKLDLSIEVEPTFPNSYFNLGLTLAMNKEFHEAVNVLNQYRELASPDDHSQADDLIQKLLATMDE